MEKKATEVLKVWESRKYYEFAKKGSQERKHFGMRVLKILSKNSNKILDLGCGEGTRLAYLAKGKEGVGVDISSTAITLARKSYPHLKFIKKDLTKLPFDDNSFDLVYSAFVLEHTSNPEEVVNEAVRVTKDKGFLVFIAPNYGAPNRASPPFKGSRILKFLKGVLYDFNFLQMGKKLHWNKVEPIQEENMYQPDYDTTCEPYIGSLAYFLERKGLSIKTISSCWEEELANAKLHQRVFRFLANLNLYPFVFWGPHLVVAAQKN